MAEEKKGDLSHVDSKYAPREELQVYHTANYADRTAATYEGDPERRGSRSNSVSLNRNVTAR